MEDPTKFDVKGNEWTVMFFFAADNSLSPLVVSQVKAIKDAGFQADTNVLVHFDPSEEGEPTRVYHVNRVRKQDLIDRRLEPTMIGDDNNSFVKNGVEDYIRPTEIDASKGPASAAMKTALANPDDVSAAAALENFIGYSLENYPAKHYILFLVGHGMIVANDAFLPDDSTDTGITLRRLNKILAQFTPNGSATSLELLALHSCSMSSIEVAYELKGKANYMMACQGTSYVGGWPYRQLMKKVFRTVKKASDTNSTRASENGGSEPVKEVDIEELVEKLYYLSLFNAPDFCLAGYSADLSLSSLKENKVNSLSEPLQALIYLLKEGLNVSSVRGLIQLAHLQSQSYWAESYTDLYDFCRCLRRECASQITGWADIGPAGSSVVRTVEDLKSACRRVMEALDTVKSERREDRFRGLVVQSDYLGPLYQYSHGLSVYFPGPSSSAWCLQTAIPSRNANRRTKPAPSRKRASARRNPGK